MLNCENTNKHLFNFNGGIVVEGRHVAMLLVLTRDEDSIRLLKLGNFFSKEGVDFDIFFDFDF